MRRYDEHLERLGLDVVVLECRTTQCRSLFSLSPAASGLVRTRRITCCTLHPFLIDVSEGVKMGEKISQEGRRRGMKVRGDEGEGA